MPNYDILHKPTGDITERFLTLSGLKELLENPDYEVAFLKMNIGDPVSLGIKQVPSDFTNHVLAPIERHYNNGKQRETRFGRKKHQV